MLAQVREHTLIQGRFPVRTPTSLAPAARRLSQGRFSAAETLSGDRGDGTGPGPARGPFGLLLKTDKLASMKASRPPGRSTATCGSKNTRTRGGKTPEAVSMFEGPGLPPARRVSSKEALTRSGGERAAGDSIRPPSGQRSEPRHGLLGSGRGPSRTGSLRNAMAASSRFEQPVTP